MGGKKRENRNKESLERNNGGKSQKVWKKRKIGKIERLEKRKNERRTAKEETKKKKKVWKNRKNEK